MPRRHNGQFRSHAALTLGELLVASVLLIVILTLAAGFFAQQSKLSQRTQVLATMQDQARLSMHLLTTDLVLSGAGVYVNGDGTIDEGSEAYGFPFSLCVREGVAGAYLGDCMDLNADDPTAFAFATTYVNSLRPIDQACREVGYWLDAGTLYRLDRHCAADGNDAPQVMNIDDTRPTTASPIADDILGIRVELRCEDGSSGTDFDTSCADGLVRSAYVTLVTESEHPVPTPPAGNVAMAGVACAAEHACLELSQEASLPNLKE